MTVLLSGGDGYYSREVTIADEQFKIRELDDQETVEADERTAKMEALQAKAAPLQEKTNGRPLTDTQRKQLHELGQANMAAVEELVNYVVVRGVVGWSLKEDCTPQNIVRLPRWVRAQLCRAIMRDTTFTSGLTEEEAAFLAPSLAGSAPANL